MEGETAAKEETLPPGFRFHPTDEELITHYLISKISDADFPARAIADVDLNKCEPWDLPAKAKMGEKEWYFFSLRDRKYPTGVRTNRATNTGYWKTTGKDKEIFNSSNTELVGMKKTLVFYRGRAPRGEKSNWVMHEYRIHSKSAFRNAKDEWVVCRVFQKSAGIKKYPSNPAPARSSNPYNLDVSSSHLIPQEMLQQADGLPPYSSMGRNYLELAELARNNNTSMIMNNNIPLQSASHMNYLANGGFTISGLNLNLGGRSVAPSSFPQHGMNQHEHLLMNGSSSSMMNSGNSHHMIGAEAGYGVDMSNANGGTNRYVNVNNMDQCLDLENYWPPTY